MICNCGLSIRCKFFFIYPNSIAVLTSDCFLFLVVKREKGEELEAYSWYISLSTIPVSNLHASIQIALA